MADAGLGRRLEREGGEDAPRVGPDPTLDEAELGRLLAACGTVEIGAVEAAVIDIGEEVLARLGRAARVEQDDITEDEARDALMKLDPLWDELFPAEQARIVQLLVERVDVRMQGVEVRLRPNGLAGLVREVAGSRRAAA